MFFSTQLYIIEDETDSLSLRKNYKEEGTTFNEKMLGKTKKKKEGYNKLENEIALSKSKKKKIPSLITYLLIIPSINCNGLEGRRRTRIKIPTKRIKT